VKKEKIGQDKRKRMRKMEVGDNYLCHYLAVLVVLRACSSSFSFLLTSFYFLELS
jgi:hypothetical protein